MCEWQFYDGGEANNCELEIWQLVDIDGEIIDEYEVYPDEELAKDLYAISEQIHIDRLNGEDE